MNETNRRSDAELRRLVERGRNGDRAALETLVAAIQPDVFRLALRFLWHPQDAEDASQEILVRVITHLSSYEGRSSFRTWVYRVACNRLLTLRRRRAERQAMTPIEFAEDLGDGLSEVPVRAVGADEATLATEVKIGCTLAMLQCLDRAHRIAYILGEILELDHGEASRVLEIAPSTYRKRLSRARATIVGLLQKSCGIVEPANPCRCRKRVDRAVEIGRVDPSKLLFASSGREQEFAETVATIRRLEGARRAAALYRSHRLPAPREAFADRIRTLMEAF